MDVLIQVLVLVATLATAAYTISQLLTEAIKFLSTLNNQLAEIKIKLEDALEDLLLYHNDSIKNKEQISELIARLESIELFLDSKLRYLRDIRRNIK